MAVMVTVVMVVMAVVMAVIMPAPARVAMGVIMVLGVIMMVIMVMVVVMILGGQRLGELVLDRRSLLAAAIHVLDGQRHDLRGEADVIGVAEVVAPQPAGPVENQQRRRALHLVGRKRLRWAFAIRLVDADWERPLVFALENLERFLGHDLVVLEDAV
jgi:hypothetical protein